MTMTMSATTAHQIPTEGAPVNHILLVEDDPTYSYLLRRIIADESNGEFTVESVDVLAKALDRLHRDGIDCVLLDLHLPDSLGLDTFKEVNQNAPETPVVVLSGLDDQKIAVQAVREGAQDYLVKGSIEGILVVRALRHAIERHNSQEHWRHLSLEDDLTKLHNRRGFLTLGEQHMRLARRKKYPLVVLFLDLDGLKQINDSLGHDVGNQAILQTGGILRGCFRETDLIARLGGDEFAVLLEDVGPRRFQRLLQRLEKKIAEANALPARTFQLSISWGAATLDPGDETTLEELIRQADMDMYAAKRAKKAM